MKDWDSIDRKISWRNKLHILVWVIPGTEEPAGLPIPLGPKELDTIWAATHTRILYNRHQQLFKGCIINLRVPVIEQILYNVHQKERISLTFLFLICNFTNRLNCINLWWTHFLDLCLIGVFIGKIDN